MTRLFIVEKTCFFSQQEQRGKVLSTKWRGWLTHGFSDTTIKDIALKALHVMFVLLLQKPSKDSKSKDHLKSLERRFGIWKEGNIDKLYEEEKTV